MRKLSSVFALFFLVSCLTTQAQGVRIGALPGPPSSDAGLEIDFNDKGLLLPRLSTAQRNLISGPNDGLVIFNTTTECAELYVNNGWVTMACACSQAPNAPTNIQFPSPLPCVGDTAVAVVVSPVSGANGYQWTVPSGLSIRSGQGSDTLLVDITGPVNGNVQVSAQNGCGFSSPYLQVWSIQAPDAGFTTNPGVVSVNNAATFNPNSSGQHQWTFNSGTPGSSVASNPSVTWSQTGTYTVIHQITDANGCSNSDTVALTVSNCITGGNATFNYTGSIQNWNVPAGVCQVTFDVRGAQGGDGSAGSGGLGARIVGTVAVNPGQTFQLLVGQKGQNNPSSGSHNGQSTGGGGGSYVVGNGQPVVVAGGGGGGGGISGGLNASTSPNGVNGSGPGGASGGTNGNGGSNNGGMNSGRGGGGFSGNGLAPPGDSAVGGPGQSFTNGGAGGSNGAHAGAGGFGGGGGGGNYGGGGGGGYSGGGGGSSNGYGGGGGGSFNSGSNPSNTAGFQSGNGQILVTW